MSGYNALLALSFALTGLSLYWDLKVNRRLRRANEGLAQRNVELLVRVETLTSGVQATNQVKQWAAEQAGGDK